MGTSRGHKRGLSWPPAGTSDGHNRGLPHGHGQLGLLPTLFSCSIGTSAWGSRSSSHCRSSRVAQPPILAVSPNSLSTSSIFSLPLTRLGGICRFSTSTHTIRHSLRLSLPYSLGHGLNQCCLTSCDGSVWPLGTSRPGHLRAVHLRFSAGADPGELPGTCISRDRPDWFGNAMLRQVLQRLIRAAPNLDLYPVLPKMLFAAGAKSYHFGGSFPHSSVMGSPTSSDLYGRIGPWTKVHLVDAAVFPSVAPTTFTLTIMANSHRIAAAALTMPW